MNYTGPDLLALPHVVDDLVQFVVGEWQPEHSKRKLLVTHLTECLYCRMALIALLSAEHAFERTICSHETNACDLVLRFITIHHEIEAGEPEYMAAYAEAIALEGRERADMRFPLLAKHIKMCMRCKSTLEETLTFLKEVKKIP